MPSKSKFCPADLEPDAAHISVFLQRPSKAWGRRTGQGPRKPVLRGAARPQPFSAGQHSQSAALRVGRGRKRSSAPAPAVVYEGSHRQPSFASTFFAATRNASSRHYPYFRDFFVNFQHAIRAQHRSLEPRESCSLTSSDHSNMRAPPPG